MIALSTEVYVRTKTGQENFEQQEREIENWKEEKQVIEISMPSENDTSERVLIAEDDVVRAFPIRHLFKIPDNILITEIYSAWYQPCLFHENLDKFKTLDVVTNLGGGSTVAVMAQGIAGEDAQINLRVHILCEFEQKT